MPAHTTAQSATKTIHFQSRRQLPLRDRRAVWPHLRWDFSERCPQRELVTFIPERRKLLPARVKRRATPGKRIPFFVIISDTSWYRNSGGALVYRENAGFTFGAFRMPYGRGWFCVLCRQGAVCGPQTPSCRPRRVVPVSSSAALTVPLASCWSVLPFQ